MDSTSIESRYRERFAGSAALYERAVQVIPAGINHDVRRISPFPIYIDHAVGCRKWDVDGNEFIDYADGHGSLILGHAHPTLTRVMQEQAGRVTHASAPTEHEVRWAELVTEIVPCAERVRFVLSGTEATMLAIRLVRAFTGKSIIVRLDGHFHGWHDYAMIDWLPPFDVPSSAGVPIAVAATLRPVPVDDLDALEGALARNDVAGVIVEPDGAAGGTVPSSPTYLTGLRELTRRYNVPLIFDEVVTGFRLAPGGAQEYFGVVPDVATFAKAIAGGMPSGAVAGRRDIMEGLAFREDPEWNRRQRVRHMGTYSAHPMAAAVGSAVLELLKDGVVQDYTAQLADRLRAGLNAAMREAGVIGCTYGVRSCFRFLLDDPGELPDTRDSQEFLAEVPSLRLLAGTRPALREALHRALFLEGLDVLAGDHGWLSQAHTVADVDTSVDAFARALRRVIDEGWVRTTDSPIGTAWQTRG